MIASAAIAAASLALVACGGSDKSSSTSTTAGGGGKTSSTVTVPGVKGQDLASAEASLRAAGLTPVSQKRYSTSVAKGQIVKSFPSGGTLADRGSKVDLVVSRGTKPVSQQASTGTGGSGGSNGSGSGSSGSGSNGGTPAVNSPRGQQQLHQSPDCKNAPPPPPGYTGPVQC
jgi:beta-lactam-binding protein with PASTA domain